MSETDYVAKAKEAIIGDLQYLLSLPEQIVRSDHPTIKGKYVKLNMFLDGFLSAEEIVETFYTATLLEHHTITSMPPSLLPTETVLQLSREPYLDRILRTTRQNLAEALKQARPQLVDLLEKAIM